ncbi:MAG: hypothetical protein IJD41_04620, partial [Alphaproteobacteria bacterium]|nr:hypothetical protein [Alphaproteobacteria bacterium]
PVVNTGVRNNVLNDGGNLILDKKNCLVYISNLSERCCVKRTLNMTNKVNIFNNGAKVARFGNAKNAVPFAVGKMLSERGIDCTKHQYEM